MSRRGFFCERHCGGIARGGGNGGGSGGGYQRGMVASQSVEPQQNADMYCNPIHSPYGEYYHENHYYIAGAPPELCPPPVCTIQGDYGETRPQFDILNTNL